MAGTPIIIKDGSTTRGLPLKKASATGGPSRSIPTIGSAALDAWRNAAAERGVYSIESRLRRADGVYRWWLVRGVPQQDGAGNIIRWFGTCTDIHDLKTAEIKIKRLNRVYAVSSGINALIVRATDRDELFNEACRIAVEEGGFQHEHNVSCRSKRDDDQSGRLGGQG